MKLYTIVEVQSGVAVTAQSFLKLDEAQTYFHRISKNRNLEEDDIQLFEQEIRPE